MRGAAASTRRTFLKAAVAAGIGVGTGAAAHGFLYERFNLSLTRTAFPVAGLPEALRGLRIGFLTDIHRSATVSHEQVSAAVALLMAQRPDLIVLGGDYVSFADRRYMHPAADALAPLSAPFGVIAILGNHDDDRDMPAALVAKGFTVLRDARTRFTIRGEPMDFIGIRYWTHKVTDLVHLMRGALPHAILLAHTPKRLIEAQQLAISAVISGHTHGGQIVLPGLGPIAAREFPVIAGLARKQGTTIFVSRGVGTVYVPIRINCPPEVAVLTLEPTLPQ
ncbi:MAG TPA: metallophosphoesterase [Vicinamibacterales bacterium]|nr:metallophosphoesterase [Vicinamibacterales bacterium]